MTALRAGEEVANLRALLEAEVAERKVLEKELLNLRERLDAFFRATPAGLAIIDDSLRYVQINEALARLNGLTVQEHLGKTVQEIVPSIAPSIVPTLKKILATGEHVSNMELVGETAGDPGNPRSWSASFVPLYGWNGRPCGLSAQVVDLTPQKKLESALSEAEARSRMLMHESSDTIIIFDEHGKIEDVNRRGQEVLLYSREELLSLNVRDIIPAEDLAVAPIRFSDLLEGKTVRRKRRLLRKDGSLVAVEVIGQMVGEGRMQAIIRDLSNRESLAHASHTNGRSLGMKADAVCFDEPTSSTNIGLLRKMSAALLNAAQILEQAGSQVFHPLPEIEGGVSFYDEVSRFEVDLLKRALKTTGGKQKPAATLLGIKQTTLHTMIRRHNIDLSEFGS